MKASSRLCACASLTLLALAFSPPVYSIQQLPCVPATELAKRAYSRIVSTAQPLFAADHRTAFWDIHEYASACPEVRKMAKELLDTGHSPQSKKPTNDELMRAFFGTRGLNLPSGCFGTEGFACEIIISNPGGGNTAGSVKNWYLLDRDKLRQTPNSEFQWRAIDSKTIQLPSVKQVPGK